MRERGMPNVRGRRLPRSTRSSSGRARMRRICCGKPRGWAMPCAPKCIWPGWVRRCAWRRADRSSNCGPLPMGWWRFSLRIAPRHVAFQRIWTAIRKAWSANGWRRYRRFSRRRWWKTNRKNRLARMPVLLLQAAPKIPGGHRAIGMPALADIVDLGGLRQFGQTVRFANGRTNPQVAAGQHIGAAESEYQEHVCGPDSHAFHLCEPLDHLGVRERGQRGEIDGA